MWRSRRPRDGGYVTAEAAVVIPSLVLLTAMLLWGLAAAAAQIRCVDAARAGARAAARDEPEGAVLAAVRSAAPAGAGVAVRRVDGLVRVTVEARSLSLTLHGEAVAAVEGQGEQEGQEGQQETAPRPGEAS
ncbi:TadE family type IV pilus minor pilin [Streptomyces sp. NPDC088354]|uniref:TadE family type IV pilus minor pilin n=1 Tax=unclassified Streptomyces TaxID=2593676 RepID=UPI0029AD32B8|nr:TadE family type IV pilus minor pilin [Streptomyces sp. MI02-7b]MDX3077979.1 TadE family type IV pilus minor pilin [Streptomyces sp. MI02-7b]